VAPLPLTKLGARYVKQGDDKTEMQKKIKQLIQDISRSLYQKDTSLLTTAIIKKRTQQQQTSLYL
jgi:hypothetical protein